MREGCEEESEEMLEQQLVCYEFYLKKKQNTSKQKPKKRAIENTSDIFPVGKYC